MKDKDQKSLEALYENTQRLYTREEADELSATGKYKLTDGSKVWISDKGVKYWIEGNGLHRLDGPAVVFTDGVKHWWVKCQQLSEEEFNDHPLVKAYRLKQKIKERGSSEEEDVMADIFA